MGGKRGKLVQSVWPIRKKTCIVPALVASFCSFVKVQYAHSCLEMSHVAGYVHDPSRDGWVPKALATRDGFGVVGWRSTVKI